MDLSTGAILCDSFSQPAYSFITTDIEILDDGRVFAIGLDNSGGDCFSWIRDFDGSCGFQRDIYYPGHTYAQFERVYPRDVLLATTSLKRPPETASFSITWLQLNHEAPVARFDSRDFLPDGCRVPLMEKAGERVAVAGEHAFGTAQELILGTVGSSDVDVELVRPNATKSYAALQVAWSGDHILMLGKETNIGGGSPRRIVLLFDENRVLQDTDVEGNLPTPVSMAIGEDGGIYTVGAGGPPGIVLTKLLISGAIGVPAAEVKTPAVSRLGLPSPNPATSSVRLEYDVAGEGEATLEIYDPAGRLVTRLVEGKRSPGNHVAEWDTRSVAKGVYLARFKAGSSYATRKVVVE